ncbi:SUMF1/EgtB/PvdO family nonheme iron enzyme [Candidatus Woesearchaeota archaeon]|nr:SUMF1/EgtB/PvdO family nonheme iron enzyme [Candidatus Woesearchaeota archaeon]
MKARNTLLSLLGAGLIYAGCGEEFSSSSSSSRTDAQQDAVDTSVDAKKEVSVDVAEDGGETNAYQIKSCLDQDKDGYYGMVADEECYAPYGKDGDCNDNNKLIYPGAIELCNAVDDNCDGQTDEGLLNQSYYTGLTGTSGVGSCTAGIKSCVNGAWEITTPEVTPAITELCDGKDNNCNTFVDEGVPMSTFYLDNDKDGFGDLNQSIVGCTAVDGSVYSSGVKMLNYITQDGDCNDTDAKINPDATEICNAIDDDCDTIVDNGLEQEVKCGLNNNGTKTTYCVDGSTVDKTVCVDPDECKVGDIKVCSTACGTGIETCVDGVYVNCTATLPSTEVCDGKDNNCDGITDEGLANFVFYEDVDGDNFGNLNASTIACSAPLGYVLDYTDCDDSNAKIKPGADEICDLLDNNCDGTTDEGFPTFSYFKDGDGDGYGLKTDEKKSCKAPDGYVTDKNDCDDTNPEVNPAAIEKLVDGIDNNCNGYIDEDFEYKNCYKDADQDGFGNKSESEKIFLVGKCSDGYVLTNNDCNDADPKINPLAEENCDTIDNNCDGKLYLSGKGVVLEQVIAGCGFNKNGTQKQKCNEVGIWVDDGDCADPDKCEAGVGKACEVHPDAPGFTCNLIGGVYQLVPIGAEESTKFPDGIDKDCNGIVDDNHFVFVPAGSYSAGCEYSSDSKCKYVGNPLHDVVTAGFYISKFEVTQKQYQKCIDNDKCTGTTDGGSNSPVTNLIQAQAEEYCKYAGGRLPTADEWEVAAKGGKAENIYPWGTLEPSCNLTNYKYCSDKPGEVGSYPLDKSTFGAGIYDMGGNISEWTSTPYGGVFAIVKGGNWKEEAEYVLVYNEQIKDPVKGEDTIGFRCVLDKIE